MTKILLSHGADRSLRNVRGETPLDSLNRGGHAAQEELVELLAP
jgi:hypothetical protein